MLYRTLHLSFVRHAKLLRFVVSIHALNTKPFSCKYMNCFFFMFFLFYNILFRSLNILFTNKLNSEIVDELVLTLWQNFTLYVLFISVILITIGFTVFAVRIDTNAVSISIPFSGGLHVCFGMAVTAAVCAFMSTGLLLQAYASAHNRHHLQNPALIGQL